MVKDGVGDEPRIAPWRLPHWEAGGATYFLGFSRASRAEAAGNESDLGPDTEDGEGAPYPEFRIDGDGWVGILYWEGSP
jgi:hypothetical protein